MTTDEPHAAPAWSTRRVAEELGVCARTVHRLRLARKLPATNVGAGRVKRWRFDPEAVLAFKRGDPLPAPDDLAARRRRRREANRSPAYC